MKLWLNDNKQGFTLMEVVVATGIFVIMTMATMGIFSSVLKAQQNTLAQTRLERDAQLVMETIVKSIRSSRVDYEEYENITGSADPAFPVPTSTLILISVNDERIRYQFNPAGFSIDVENSGITSPMTSSDVRVTSMNFYIEPQANPFLTGDPPQTQPRVTVVFSLESSNVKETAQATLQQTVPQRGGGI